MQKLGKLVGSGYHFFKTYRQNLYGLFARGQQVCAPLKLVNVTDYAAVDIAVCHAYHGYRLDVDHLAVVIKQYFGARHKLFARVDTVFFKKRDVFLAAQKGYAVGGGFKVEKAAAVGFFGPLFGVAVAVKDNSAVLFNRFFYYLFNARFYVAAIFQNIGKIGQRIGNDGVKYRVAVGYRLA